MKLASKFILGSTCLLVSAFAVAQSHGTDFKPEQHGFRFVNNFDNRVELPAGMDIRTSGLCGGMVYTAMDHFLAGRRPIPQQDYMPAEGTPLQRYLYQRQFASLVRNADKWSEVSLNPGGVRDSEFFNWGLQTSGGGRLEELRSFLDHGMPVPLGLKADHGGDHQVLAIGYDMGRYHGDLRAYAGDLKIFVYDPNHPMMTMTLVPDMAAKVYRYPADRADGDTNTWRTYFVDKKYIAQVPPDLSTPAYPSDNLVHELLLTFVTGADDLRGGNDNVALTVNLFDGNPQVYRSINGGRRWMSNTSMTARVVLTRPVELKNIHNLILSTTFSGGGGGDNWDMRSVQVRAIGGNVDQVVVNSTHYHRFTGNDQQWELSVNAPAAPATGQVARLMFEIRTGGDDLRGDKDNLKIEIHFADGRTQLAWNVNNSAHWANNTTNYVYIQLDRPVPPDQIRSVTLATSFGGGSGGDNWNMDSLKITAEGRGISRVIGTYGFNRFTGDHARLDVPTH